MSNPASNVGIVHDIANIHDYTMVVLCSYIVWKQLALCMPDAASALWCTMSRPTVQEDPIH